MPVQTAYKHVWAPKCGRCPRPASYEVRDRWHRSEGTYCEVHADEKVEAMNAYAAAQQSLSDTPRR